MPDNRANVKRRIKAALKKLLLQPVVRSGLPVLLQRTVFRRGLTIVTYHGVLRTPLPADDWCFLDAADFADLRDGGFFLDRGASRWLHAGDAPANSEGVPFGPH